MVKIKKSCLICRKEFEMTPSKIKQGLGKYCSQECYHKSREKKVECKCKICGKKFEKCLSKTVGGRGNYCSNECLHKSQERKITRVCKECGKKFKILPSNTKNGYGKYCSRECFFKSRTKRVKCICKVCGEEFETKQSNIKRGQGKYCSPQCFYKSQETKVKCKCETCGEEFVINQSRINNGGGKYCSLKCFYKSLENKVQCKCKHCGKEFEVKLSKINIGSGKYCSKECYNKANSGSNNANWTGGPKEYCEKFNNAFKRRVLAFWYLNNENICPVCEEPIIDETPHCHHAYYDKKACCLTDLDGKYFCNLGIKNNQKTFEIIGDPNKFTPLHGNCHGKTTSKKEREFYARKFETIINEKFGGKSYFTEEEYKEFLIYHPEWEIPYRYPKKKK